MPEVQINRFETQYRLPPAALDQQRRLDHVRLEMLDRAFQLALAQNGIGEDAEVCIRSVASAVRLRLDRSDESVTASWSEAIAAQISHALRNGATSNTVIYHSRRQALLDFASCIARGDRRRAWAWRQLGLWRSTNSYSEPQSIVELVRALCAASDLLVPTLRALAEAGWLHPIASLITERQWVELAAAALVNTGLVHLLDETSEASSSRALRSAFRVLGRSKLAGAISANSSLKETSVAARRAIAILSIMEAEPILLSTAAASATIELIADAIRSPRNETISSLDDSLDEDPALPKVDRRRPANTDERQLMKERPESEAAENTGNTPGASRETGSAREQRQREKVKVAATETPSQPLDLRQRSLTRSGGLLFLISVVNELGLPGEISDHELLGARPFTWVMHQLALTLAPVQPNDPAALAFAGLAPQATPPSLDEPPLNETEAAAIAELAARIIAQLRLLLDRPAEPAQTLLDLVCARRAEVVADPGWLELRLSLDEVSTEIRRAGLDLDPGYVPWLGVVVKFVYE